jgi:hypothetical protein
VDNAGISTVQTPGYTVAPKEGKTGGNNDYLGNMKKYDSIMLLVEQDTIITHLIQYNPCCSSFHLYWTVLMNILHDGQHVFLCVYQVKLTKYLFIFGK